jgi:hypothetical protein
MIVGKGKCSEVYSTSNKRRLVPSTGHIFDVQHYKIHKKGSRIATALLSAE